MNKWHPTIDDLRWQDIATEKKQVFKDVFLRVDTGGKHKVLIGCWVSKKVMDGLVLRNPTRLITGQELDLLGNRYWESCHVDRLFTRKYGAYMCRVKHSCLFNGIPTHWMPLPAPPKMEGV